MSWYQSDINYIPPEPYVPPEWSTGTDEEIVTALQKHYAGEIDLTQYWSVGDKRQVTLSEMAASGVSESHVEQTVTFVLSNVGGKTLSDGVTTCAFQVDQVDSLSERGYMNRTSTNATGWKTSARRTWCNSIYKNAIPSTLLPIFKEFINQSGLGNNSTSGVENTNDYFALRAEVEIFGSVSYSVSGEGTQTDWYKTSSNRIKTDSISTAWFERSPGSGRNNMFCGVSNGSATVFGANNTCGIAPFGVI